MFSNLDTQTTARLAEKCGEIAAFVIEINKNTISEAASLKLSEDIRNAIARAMIVAYGVGFAKCIEVSKRTDAAQDNTPFGTIPVKLKGGQPIGEHQPQYETIHVRRGMVPLNYIDPDSKMMVFDNAPYMETAFMVDDVTIARLNAGMPLVLRVLGTQWPPYAINQVGQDQLDMTDPATAMACRGPQEL